MGNIQEKACCRNVCKDDNEFRSDMNFNSERMIKKIIFLQQSVKKFLFRVRYGINKNNSKLKYKSDRIKIEIDIKASKSKAASPHSRHAPIFNIDNKAPYDLLKVPGMLMDPEHKISPNFLNRKVLEIEKNLGAFTLTEKEAYVLSFSEMKKFSIMYSDNSLYIGHYNKNWQKEGFGIFYMTDGSKYEGFFQTDKMQGRGRLINYLGFFYEGEFSDNKANGFGKYVTADGSIYIGYWKDDKQNGIGEEVFPDGSRYEGNFLFGKKHGKGLFTFQDNSKYEGFFENNLIHGYGIYNWIDGRTFQGEWKDNQMHGRGLFGWPDKKKYVGQYKNDKKHGYGYFFWPEGKKYEGMWEDGKQHGYGIFSSHKSSKMGIWNMGKKIKWINPEDQEYNEINDFLNRHKEDAKLTELSIN